MLAQRSERRFSWIVFGLALMLVGGWLMLATIQAARLKVLTCERPEADPVVCRVQLVWLGVVLREAPIELQGAVVGYSRPETHHLFLKTADDLILFSASSPGEIGLQAEAERINGFLQTPSGERLVVRFGGALGQLPLGIVGSLIAAGGFFLAVNGFRIVVRPAHANMIERVLFSPDGGLLASASWDKRVHLWQVADGTLIRTLAGGIGPAVDLAFTPDGRLLATASWDGRIYLWRVADGALLRTLSSSEDAVTCLAVAVDGQTLASGAWDKLVRLWQIDDGALRQTLTGHEGTVAGLAFTPEGHTLISGSADRTVRLWRIGAGACLKVLAHPEPVTCVAIAPDGRSFVSGSTDHLIRLWSLPGGDLQGIFEGHTGWIRSLAFTPDGQQLVSASTDQTVRLWQVDDGGLQATLAGHTAEVTSVDLSPGGEVIASGSGDQTVRLWYVEDEHLRENPLVTTLRRGNDS